MLCASRLRLDPTTEQHAGLLVLGDAPAIVAFARMHPDLAGRTVTVEAASGGALGHTQFASACAPSSRDSAGGHGHGSGHGSAINGHAADASTRCAHGIADPNGVWTRTMVDFYVGGSVCLPFELPTPR